MYSFAEQIQREESERTVKVTVKVNWHNVQVKRTTYSIVVVFQTIKFPMWRYIDLIHLLQNKHEIFPGACPANFMSCSNFMSCYCNFTFSSFLLYFQFTTDTLSTTMCLGRCTSGRFDVTLLSLYLLLISSLLSLSGTYVQCADSCGRMSGIFHGTILST